MNKYIEKLAEMGTLDKLKERAKTDKRFAKPPEIDRHYVDHSSDTGSEDQLHTDESNRIASS